MRNWPATLHITENNVTHSRNAMFGTAFRDCSRTKNIKVVHLETLEASAFRSILRGNIFKAQTQSCVSLS